MSRAGASSSSTAGGREDRSARWALGPVGYWRESELPLASLLFLLPLIVIYEVGTRFFTSGASAGRDRLTGAPSRSRRRKTRAENRAPGRAISSTRAPRW